MRRLRPLRQRSLAALVSILPFTEAFPSGFFLETEGTGVYLLKFEDLDEWDVSPVPYTDITLTRGGDSIHFWIEDQNADAEFGPGDKIEFIVPSPKQGGIDPSPFPTRLTISPDRRESSRGIASPAIPSAAGSDAQSVRVEAFVEKNLIRTAFSLPDFSEIDFEYWRKLSPLDSEPYAYDLGEEALWSVARQTDISIRISLRGSTWANFDSRGFHEHALRVKAGSEATEHFWSGKEETILELKGVTFENTKGAIEFRIPPRNSPTGEFLADVTFLNWLEWSAPIRSDALVHAGSALPLSVEESRNGKLNGAATITLPSSEEEFSIYTTGGVRWDFPLSGGEFTIDFVDDGGALLVRESLKNSVIGIRPEKTNLLGGADQPESSYLLVTPEFLLEGTRKLARIHERTGLATQIATVEEIRDTYGEGQLDSDAIQKSIRAWFADRHREAPSYVLLVGDASWEPPGTGRNLIPTSSRLVSGSLCATDNPYACIDDEDRIPDLALGRLPVATEAEFETILAKISKFYDTAREPDNSVESLWIVDQNSVYQEMVRSMLSSPEMKEISSELIFAESEGDNEPRLDRIREAIGQGYDWVCYHGHGSRHVWRTGTADYANQSSIFDSDDVDKIAEKTDASPARVVFSSSCDNAPFDHPKDDSLGERFVLAPGAGSLTFIGASWRILSSGKPLRFWTNSLKRTENKTVGDAFLDMKQSIDDQRFVATFNLLGDPAIPIREMPLNEK